MSQNESKRTAYGLLAAVGAFIIWGSLAPLWKGLAHIDMYTVHAHRMIWLEVFAFAALVIEGRLGEVREVFKDMKAAMLISLSAIMIAISWLAFYIAVNSDRILEASLGDYMSPLMTILLGSIVLREKLSRLQYLSIGLLFIALINCIVTAGQLPVISIIIGASFAFYGLFRRGVKAKPLPSMFLETTTLLPLAVGYLVYRKITGFTIWDGADAHTIMLLMSSSVFTGLPVMLFAYGAPRVRMTALGILQYLTPTLIFLIGVVGYNEQLTPESARTFALIWSGIAVYTYDNIQTRRRQKRLLKAKPEPARS